MTDPRPTLRDARATLGVSAGASPSQVVSAFRHRARAVHPDLDDGPGAAARFAALVAAYDMVLRKAVDDTDVASAAPRAVVAEPTWSRSPHVVTRAVSTVVWEAGRPIMLVGPVVVHGPSMHDHSRQRPVGNGPRG